MPNLKTEQVQFLAVSGQVIYNKLDRIRAGRKTWEHGLNVKTKL
jgi:hypothetical protein